MDGFKGKSNFSKTFVWVYCGLNLIRICTLPKLKAFLFSLFFQGRDVPEISVCFNLAYLFKDNWK